MCCLVIYLEANSSGLKGRLYVFELKIITSKLFAIICTVEIVESDCLNPWEALTYVTTGLYPLLRSLEMKHCVLGKKGQRILEL